MSVNYIYDCSYKSKQGTLFVAWIIRRLTTNLYKWSSVSANDEALDLVLITMFNQNYLQVYHIFTIFSKLKSKCHAVGDTKQCLYLTNFDPTVHVQKFSNLWRTMNRLCNSIWNKVIVTFCKTYKSPFYCRKYHQTKWRVHTPYRIITVQK